MSKNRMCELLFTIVVSGFLYTGCAVPAATPAVAQNPTCPTRPFGDNSNACASTAFVQAAIAPLTCTTLGAFRVGTGAGAQCSDTTGAVAVVSDATNGLIVNGKSPTTGYLIDIHGGVGTPLALGATGSVVQFKSFIDTGTGTGKTFYGINNEIHLSTGTGGGAINQFYSVAEGTWNYSGTNFEGPVGIFGWGQSVRGGWVWGGTFQGICTTIAAASCIGAEVDVGNSINGTATKVGLQVVSVATDTGTISVPAQSYGYALLLQPGGSGFHSGLYFGSGVATNRLIYSAGGSLTTGIDISANLISGNALATPGPGTSPGFAVTGLGVVRLTQNAIAAPTDITGTLLHATGADSSPTLISIDSFAVAPTFNGRRANGTNAIPTGLVLNDSMAAFSGRGYTSAGAYTTARGILQIVATETWSGTNQGARLDFISTPTGSITPTTGMSLLNGTLALGVANSVLGVLTQTGSTSGTVTIQPQATAGTPTVTWGTGSGTPAVSASAPLAIASATGNITCSTCITSLVVGTTTITSGTNTRILYDNSGVLGEYTLTGTGTVVMMQTAPTFVTSMTGPLLYGGAAAGSTLTLRSTSGTGSTDAIIAGVGTDGSVESWRVVTTGQFIKGGTVAQSVVSNTAAFQIQGSNLGASSLMNGRWQSGNAAGPANYFLKSRNSTPGSFAIVQNGDGLGSIIWAGDDGSTYNSVAASISVFVDGTPGVGDMPGRMMFATTLDGSAAASVRVVIGNDGGVNIGPTQTNVGAGILNIEATTASTSKLTGSLINKGGFGNAGAVFTDTLNIISVANASTTAALCWNSGTGLVTENAAVGTCTVSDERLKNMGPRLTGALDKLLKIDGVYFTWKDQQYGVGRQIGVGAQTVEKVFPELVSTDGEGKKSADYQRLTAPIIEALREIDRRVKALETRRGR